MPPLRLVIRYLSKHPIRSLLTMGSMVIAVFLLITLQSLITTLKSGVASASNQRLIVQSAVSLFVNLPAAYQEKIEQVDGVQNTCKWNWFGGYYQDQSNFFAQFGVDPDRLFQTYPEISLMEGSAEDFQRLRTGCIVGKDLANQFNWQVGDKIPIIGALFARHDGRAWEFECTGIYEATSPNVDNRTIFFHYKFLEEALNAGLCKGPEGVSVYSVQLNAGAERTQVMADIDALFENGPQRVQTTTEAEFQAQFVSMVGNIPMFVGSIGAAVLFAILLAVINTMLMAAREQTRDIGVLKALGFNNTAVSLLMILQSLTPCLIGGALGILMAYSVAPIMVQTLGTMFPNYAVQDQTLLLAFGIAIAIGLIAGILPAVRASRLLTVNALRRTA